MNHFIYRCDVAESYWRIDSKGFCKRGEEVNMWGASVYSLSTFLKLAVNDNFILPIKNVDKIIEDYRPQKYDETDTWLLAV